MTLLPVLPESLPSSQGNSCGRCNAYRCGEPPITAGAREVVQRFRATNPRVFGSVAPGADVDGSDLDLLVDPLPAPGAPPGKPGASFLVPICCHTPGCM